MSDRRSSIDSNDSQQTDPDAIAPDSAEVTGEVRDGAETLDQESPIADQSEGASTGNSELSELEAQKDRYLRLAAEYDNYRKRTARELQQAATRGHGEVIKGLLASLDDLSRVAHVDPETTDAKSVLAGIELVERNIMKTLESLGLEVIDPVELPFDPNLHEALSTQAAETPDEDHMVAQVYQRGYLLKGQLLRPARVVVKQYQ